MTDIINDIYLPEEPGAGRMIDAQEFFPKIKLDVLSHNNSRAFHDIQAGRGTMLNVTKKHILVIKKPAGAGRKSLEDLFDKKKYATSILSLFSKQRVIRVNPISILEPLSKTRFNTLDVRSYEPLISIRTFPDIYRLPAPLSRRAKKVLRKHRKGITIGGVVFVSLSFSLILLSLAAKNYVERETIRNYNRIAALKDIRDIETLSREVHDIGNSLKTVAFVFSPFRAVLDNRFYVHPQVHLASNIIHGGSTLSDSIEQALFVAQAFTKALPEDGTCSLSSFFGSGSIGGNGCGVKMTDFLKEHRDDFEQINESLGTTLTYYAGIESLGNPLF
ncbi:TPA: hypothetical protein DCZ36_03315, partial [Candidatus Gracilibacteria bacterium]|nr:hypothetical protein [Candidatus Gracilibacteria bacterium]